MTTTTDTTPEIVAKVRQASWEDGFEAGWRAAASSLRPAPLAIPRMPVVDCPVCSGFGKLEPDNATLAFELWQVCPACSGERRLR